MNLDDHRHRRRVASRLPGPQDPPTCTVDYAVKTDLVRPSTQFAKHTHARRTHLANGIHAPCTDNPALARIGKNHLQEGSAPMPTDFEQLLTVLDLQRIDELTFLGSHPTKNPPRTYGGQLMAQALIAGSRALTHHPPPASLQTHFIAGGDTNKDIEYHVVRLRDERRFANQRVDAIQDGELLASTMLSYLVGGRGLQHGLTAPDVPDPTLLPPLDELLRGHENAVPRLINRLRPIDQRYTNDPPWVQRDTGQRLTFNRVWMKTYGPLPDDPLLHTAALVYSSDTSQLDSVLTTHGLSWGYDRIFAVSANHTIWFHRQVKFDDWVLYSTTSPVAADCRALSTGHFFNHQGHLTATAAQEGIIKHFPG